MNRRRRRRGGSSDSLELLLDTICNTFGGIVFIALLVILMLRNVSPSPAEPAGAPAAPDELEGLAGRLDAVTTELASLRVARGDLARRTETFAPDEVRELVRSRNSLAESSGELRTERDRRIAANASTAAGLARGEAELEATAETLAEAEREAERLDDDLESERKSKIREIRNPIVRETAHWRNLSLIVRYGRMYLWHRYDEDGNRLGLNTDEFVVVSDEGGYLSTHPDPTKGIPLVPGEEAGAAIRARLSRFSPTRFRVTTTVRPDSFEEFSVLRDALVAAGYEYRLIPAYDGILDRGGSNNRVQ